jgi:hypothetical protein
LRFSDSISAKILRTLALHASRAVPYREWIGFLTPASAQQQYGGSLYSGLRWRSIGPFRGGRVNGVTGVRGQP